MRNVPFIAEPKHLLIKYLEGKRNNYIQHKIPITVTDIVPGWVDTEKSKFSKMPGTYWVASTDDAATQILEAIQEKKKVAYITKRWAK